MYIDSFHRFYLKLNLYFAVLLRAKNRQKSEPIVFEPKNELIVFEPKNELIVLDDQEQARPVCKVNKSHEKMPKPSIRFDETCHWISYDDPNGKRRGYRCKREGCGQTTTVFCEKCNVHFVLSSANMLETVSACFIN